MTETTGSDQTTQTTGTSSSDQSGASDDKPTVLSDSPKTPWDVVKDIDWGDQLDELKANAEGHKATADPIGTSTSSSDSSSS